MSPFLLYLSLFSPPPAILSSLLPLWPVSALCSPVFQLLSLPLYCYTFPSTFILSSILYLYHLFPLLDSLFLSPLLFPLSVYSLLPSPHLCVSVSLFVLSSLWNSSGGCPRLLPTTVEGCINIACHCLIDHSNARNTEPPTRQVSG